MTHAPRPTISPLRWAARRAARPKGAYLRLKVPPRVTEIAPPHPWIARALPWTKTAMPLQLHRLRRLAEIAAADPGVRGLIFELSPLACGWATCQALRDVFEGLAASGKDVVVHMHLGGTIRDAYVASGASRVFISPRATLAVPGLAAEVQYLRDGLEKLGVAVEPFRRAEFKTALETLTERAMSEPQREQLTSLLGAIDRAVVDAIASGRRIPRERVRELFAKTAFQGEEAVSAGLADAVAYEDQVADRLAQPGEGAPPIVPAPRYLRLLDRSRVAIGRAPYIAVVRIAGTITDEAATAQEAGGPITSLRKVARDKRALGCVLFVDSPGGSALTSDLIHRELVRLREKKPVVTCMGDVAASGGYYVAAATEAIVAQPMTLTGSIGVIAGRLLARDLLAKLGVRTEVIRTSPHADMFSVAREADAEERRILDDQVDAHYRAFVQLVAEGRGRAVDEVEPLARGRVWSGVDARERGLVDRLGGLDDAIEEVLSRVKASDRVKAKLRPKLVHETRGPIPAIEPRAALALASGLSPDLSDLLGLLERGPTVMFYATGLPRIR